MNTDCLELRDRIVELVEGDLDRALVDRLHVHAARCRDCGRELALETRVVAALRTWPGAPEIEIGVPHPGGRPPSRLAPWRLAGVAAATAAALLLALTAWLGLPASVEPGAGSGDAVVAPGSLHPVRIVSVVESDADAPLPDDGLLALTAGVEAVVMRRPAQGR